MGPELPCPLCSQAVWKILRLRELTYYVGNSIEVFGLFVKEKVSNYQGSRVLLSEVFIPSRRRMHPVFSLLGVGSMWWVFSCSVAKRSIKDRPLSAVGSS